MKRKYIKYAHGKHTQWHKGVDTMLTREHKNGFYIVYLDGKFLTTCDNYAELREVYAQYGIAI